MHRTIKSLMDAFIQHLASRRIQLSALYKSGKPLEEWLRSELYYCVEYARYVNRFKALLKERHDRRKREPGSILSSGTADVFIGGRKNDIWIKLAYFSTDQDLGPRLETIRGYVYQLSALNATDTRLFVELIISRGKWADRAIGDCIARIQDTCGFQFDKYSPYLILTLHDEYHDPLEENIIVRLFFAYIV